MNDANRKPLMDVAESKTLCMRGNSLHGNRETLKTPSPQGVGRSEKALPYGGHARFQGDGRSHSTEEAGEQGRPEGGCGVRGGKGTDQEERQTNLTCAGHRAGEVWHRIVRHTSVARWRSRWGHDRHHLR